MGSVRSILAAMFGNSRRTRQELDKVGKSIEEDIKTEEKRKKIIRFHAQRFVEEAKQTHSLVKIEEFLEYFKNNFDRISYLTEAVLELEKKVEDNFVHLSAEFQDYETFLKELYGEDEGETDQITAVPKKKKDIDRVIERLRSKIEKYYSNFEYSVHELTQFSAELFQIIVELTRLESEAVHNITGMKLNFLSMKREIGEMYNYLKTVQNYERRLCDFLKQETKKHEIQDFDLVDLSKFKDGQNRIDREFEGIIETLEEELSKLKLDFRSLSDKNNIYSMLGEDLILLKELHHNLLSVESEENILLDSIKNRSFLKTKKFEKRVLKELNRVQKLLTRIIKSLHIAESLISYFENLMETVEDHIHKITLFGEEIAGSKRRFRDIAKMMEELESLLKKDDTDLKLYSEGLLQEYKRRFKQTKSDVYTAVKINRYGSL